MGAGFPGRVSVGFCAGWVSAPMLIIITEKTEKRDIESKKNS